MSVTFKFPDLDLWVHRGDRYISLESLLETINKMEEDDLLLSYDALRRIITAMAVAKGER